MWSVEDRSKRAENREDRKLDERWENDENVDSVLSATKR